MHEMAIAAEILDCVLDVAGRNHATRVNEIHLEVGMLRQVVPEALELAFEAVAEGTPAAGAALCLVEVKVSAVCNGCGAHYAPDIDASYVCPQCGKADARITSGDDILLKTVICEADEGSPE
jgi:hydrogenase nickel incorporation protein HypA/HybF